LEKKNQNEACKAQKDYLPLNVGLVNEESVKSLKAYSKKKKKKKKNYKLEANSANSRRNQVGVVSQ
jgi:hypothetical protein